MSSAKDLLHVIRVLFRIGERDEALAEIRRCRKLYPSSSCDDDLRRIEWDLAWERADLAFLQNGLVESANFQTDVEWVWRRVRSLEMLDPTAARREWVMARRKMGRHRAWPLWWRVQCERARLRLWPSHRPIPATVLKKLQRSLGTWMSEAVDPRTQWELLRLEWELEERLGNWPAMEGALRRAHALCLEHRSMGEFYEVLLGLARLARHQDRMGQATRRLALLRRVLKGTAWTRLRTCVEIEEKAGSEITADWVVDAERGIIHTRDRGEIVVGRQHVLLEILKALARQAGLTKAEIIQKVWREIYRPEAHDNKLYYNINRLRKLIEPDMKEPRYVLNHATGYRLAPGLKVRLLGQESPRKLLGK